jgi:thymidylate kinase
MKRLDLLGVPGVGKTTLYNLLGKNRESFNNYFVFEEAYRSAIFSKLPGFYQFVDKLNSFFKTPWFANRVFNTLVRPLERMVETEKHIIEEENLGQAIAYIQKKYPDFLAMRLSGIGKPLLLGTPDYPEDYLRYQRKTYHHINQFHILEKSLEDETIVVFDNSFAHKVLSIVNYTEDIDEKVINQYIKLMPPPAGVAILFAPPQVIVARIRKRAQNGLVNNWHRRIVDTDLLDEWVEKACEITKIARQGFLSHNYPVLDLNAELSPNTNVKIAQNFIQTL